MAKIKRPKQPLSVAAKVRETIEKAPDRVWRAQDFKELPVAAVAKTLSRLANEGELQRLSKGVYYRPGVSRFGKTLPSPLTLRTIAGERWSIYPAGIAAANLLGFTTQTGRHAEVATTGQSLPRKLIGEDTKVHTRRPKAWTTLSETDAALLDFLRRGGHTSELSPEETVQRTVFLCREKGRMSRLLAVAVSEPPRVRAILGAIGEELHMKKAVLDSLRETLNPVSRFDFGLLSGLKHARTWQMKERGRA